uniref:DDB1- and CUL4-associated factor 6-like isoform X1 n=1 Tax=Vespula vulgaris TaxID=7454 RepID=UPI0021463532|nr:DDB1- and CUL4-associated factor 6-like isoform X1 [Vespula vulgaris]XP_050854784.1 DDB1- and CUL4-associated factor 6-like isoform X1 [Vespula vulgaris]XP_050854785.1 DDB1- and CUL4-associated factor 6-like isoform X1 [Vespula vulgaris]
MRKLRSSIFHDIYNQPYDEYSRHKLYSSSKASLQLIQRMSLLKRLKVHNGCVNSICWNNTGDLILSGSDDQHLVLTNIYNYQVLTDHKTSHRANIFSAKFLPNSGDHRIVSCSGDGIILYTDLMRRTETFHNQFTCHSGTTYEVATIPGEPHSFLSCGEDGTVRWFDLRVKEKCNIARCREDVLISCQRAVTALSVNPVMPHQIAIGCSDSTVRTFDRRILGTQATGWTDNSGSVRPLCSFTVPEFDGNSYRITSLSYSPDGQDVLVSYSSDHLYLFSMKDQGNVHLRKDIQMGKGKGKKHPLRSPQPVRRLRLRGDWSDTGPDARPEREGGRRSGTEIAQARPVLHTSLMQRMTDVLSRMLNDPATRAALSGGGEDSLEGVIDQQESNQRSNDNSTASNADANREQQQIETETDNDVQVQENTSSLDQSENPNNDEIRNVVRNNSVPSNDAQVSCDLAIQSSSVSTNNFNTEEPINNDLDDVQVTESQTNLLESNNTSTNSAETRSSDGECDTEGESSNAETSCHTDMASKREENMMENLQDRLTTMRDGFLERHGSEPAVSLTYSDKSSTRATISLGVADEVIRDSYHAGPSGSQSTERLDPGPSNSYKKRMLYRSVQEKSDDSAYIDSDDEDIPSHHRLVHPVEAEMDEAIANARTSQGQESFDETYLTELCVKQKYMGHRNASFFRTMIKEANFWGNDFVMSGSDCGHVFVWERDTAKLCMLLEADQHVVNCLQPHPYLPMLATSGIDYDVKLWAPINEESSFNEKFAEDLKKRNAVMLEETKDTITVPAVFMIRMLACLNQIRRGRGRSRRRSGDENDELRGG